MSLFQLDLKLKLLSGEPIKIDDRVGYMKPLTLRQIISYGYTDFFRMLNIMAVDMNELIGNNQTRRLNLNLFDILTEFGGEETISEMEESLSLFFQEKAVFVQEAGVVVIGNHKKTRIIDRDNFDQVREVIKLQNCLKRISDDEEVEATEKAKEIKAKLALAKTITSRLKEEGDNDLDLFDMLSSISSKSYSLNKLIVFDLTLFQLYDEFKRLDLLDQYDVSIKSMLAGAKNVKLKHWSSKIEQ